MIMAASRKLQGEIDRCLKKVTEGVETFEDVWQKVHNATNSNQKEKYEADLKKEIKKLQRLRDQIKSWIASAEIKDKSSLLENRKLIETQMERFKVVERETKTKAYSKEGLGAAQKLDPAQKEKEEVTMWLVQAIDALNLQVDQFESEIESLIAGNKKKRVDKDKQDRVDELKSKVEKHRFHIKKLETILRMLDNMSVEVNTVKKIKDDIEYYIESSQDDDFQVNEYLYDDIEGIDDVELSGIAVAGSINTDSNGTPTSMNSSPIHASPSQQQSISQPAASATTETVCSTVVSTEEKKKEKLSLSTPVTNSSYNNISTSMVVKPTPVRASSAGTVGNVTGSNLSVTAAPSSATSSSKQSLQSSQNYLSTNSSLSAVSSTNIASSKRSAVHHHPVLQANPTSTSKLENFVTIAPVNVQQLPVTTSRYSNKITTGHIPAENGLQPNYNSNAVSNFANNNTSGVQSFNEHLKISHLSFLPSPQANGGPSLTSRNSTPPHVEPSSTTSMKRLCQNQESVDKIMLEDHHIDSSRPLSNNRETETTEIHIPPILGVAPLGPVPLSTEHQVNFRMMESVFNHIPHAADSERLRSYLPRNPCNTPSYYPQIPLTNADTIEYHTKLATDTLFFIFYYSEGTKSQYLAAKALKKQSWRFHTKYMMWFQRHEEPRTINEEYEQGTYIYFDYEKWTQRKKEGFTFEYKYLEDRELS